MMPLKKEFLGCLTSMCLFGVITVFGAPVTVFCPPGNPAIQFAARDIQRACAGQGNRCEILPVSMMSDKPEQSQIVLGLVQDTVLLQRLQAAGGKDPGTLDSEAYFLRLTRQDDLDTIWAVGADATGAMYAGLALAETIAQDGIDAIEETDTQPYIGKRGLKINVPLDARTPAYADCGDAAQQNMAVMWDIDFWKAHLDAMARYRYNTITLWNQHPFPSMVRVPDYPDVALEDVKIADIDWREWFPKNAGFGGSHGVTPDILENLKTIKRMKIEEKIAFWREVMEYAQDRGIEFHIITWNIFFENALQQRFPGKPTQMLKEVWSRASKIIPAVNREHWHDWDFQWAVEACLGRNGYHAITDACWKSGSRAVADEIQEHADFVLLKLDGLRQTGNDKTWLRTLGDIEAMAHLGNYYAEKFRAADNKDKNLPQAVEHLKKALAHWKRYAEVGKRQYKSQLLSKGGLADWQLGYENALNDFTLLQSAD